jgi:hypothetical protein
LRRCRRVYCHFALIFNYDEIDVIWSRKFCSVSLGSRSIITKVGILSKFWYNISDLDDGIVLRSCHWKAILTSRYNHLPSWFEDLGLMGYRLISAYEWLIGARLKYTVASSDIRTRRLKTIIFLFGKLNWNISFNAWILYFYFSFTHQSPLAFNAFNLILRTANNRFITARPVDSLDPWNDKRFDTRSSVGEVHK